MKRAEALATIRKHQPRPLDVFKIETNGGEIVFTCCDDMGRCFYGFYDDIDGFELQYAGMVEDLE